MANGADQDSLGLRDLLAFSILILSVVAVSTLAGIIVWNKPENANVVMSAVLPLLGSWVGTVLAFYFSKDNFAAATRSVSEMAKQVTSQEKLQTMLAKEKMIPKEQMFWMTFAPDTKLKDILAQLTAANKGMRVPFLNADDTPQYVIHRSTIEGYLAAEALKGTPNLADITLAQLLADPDLKDRIGESFASVREDATLADAKKEMEKSPNIQDVFVTKRGDKKEPALGWITNVIVEDNSRI